MQQSNADVTFGTISPKSIERSPPCIAAPACSNTHPHIHPYKHACAYTHKPTRMSKIKYIHTRRT